METASINCITRLRIHSDGPGVRSVIFMQGCPLRCFWCCNPETRFGTDYKVLSSSQLFQYILPDIPYYEASGGGVTFSGGEPLLWGSFLAEFLTEYGTGFTADMETSLYADRETIDRLIPLIHQWNIDFKVFHPVSHLSYTGKSNKKILENLRYLASRIPKEQIIITYPVIPGYNDSDQNIRKMMRFLQELGIFQIELHPYRKFSEDKKRKLGLSVREVPQLSPEQYAHIVSLLREGGFTLVERKTLYSKEKCAYLKQLRKDLCQTHGLCVEFLQCTHTGDCIGTCPQCEYELQQINQALRGKVHTVRQIPATLIPDAQDL